MTEVEFSCSTCRFWEEQSQCCRRYAPSPILGSGEPGDERQNTLWALTKADDWCGEYEALWDEEAEEAEEYDDAEDEEWNADGTLNWTPPAPTPGARRGLLG